MSCSAPACQRMPAARAGSWHAAASHPSVPPEPRPLSARPPSRPPAAPTSAPPLAPSEQRERGSWAALGGLQHTPGHPASMPCAARRSLNQHSCPSSAAALAPPRPLPRCRRPPRPSPPRPRRARRCRPARRWCRAGTPARRGTPPASARGRTQRERLPTQRAAARWVANREGLCGAARRKDGSRRLGRPAPVVGRQNAKGALADTKRSLPCPALPRRASSNACPPTSAPTKSAGRTRCSTKGCRRVPTPPTPPSPALFFFFADEMHCLHARIAVQTRINECQ